MKNLALLFLGLWVAMGGASSLWGQSTGYAQTNLVGNLAGVANHTDAQLTNPWGIAFLAGQPFWIANNNGGTSTLYDDQGNKQVGTIGIPVASLNPCPTGCPTGTVANASADFGGSDFIFDTEDGIVASWAVGANAVVAFDNSAASAVYKGLALVTNGTGSFLLAANFRTGKIDVLDRSFLVSALAGSFTDPNLPAGFAPHGVKVIGNQVFVAYAMQDAAKHDAVPGAGSGVIDIFDQNGNFVKTFASGGTLNAPWGVVAAPAAFGTFSNAILVGNFGDGTISAFNATTGAAMGQMADTNNATIKNPGLWDLVFGAGGTGDPDTLYLTAGGSDQTHGLFAAIVPAAVSGQADFSLTLSAQSATVTPGGSTQIMVGASPVAGFNSPVALSCPNIPAGVTCAFSNSDIAPGASSTLTISLAASAPPTGYSIMGMTLGWIPLSGLGLAGLAFAGRPEKRKATNRRGRALAWSTGLGLVMLLTVFAIGCGGYGSNSMTATGQKVTVMVKGTAAGLTHSTPVTLTIQ
ncbi:MAG: TIGR03118 family protein [Terriglobales bacterium]